MMHQTSFINLYMGLINLSLHLYYSISVLTMTGLEDILISGKIYRCIVPITAASPYPSLQKVLT